MHQYIPVCGKVSSMTNKQYGKDKIMNKVHSSVQSYPFFLSSFSQNVQKAFVLLSLPLQFLSVLVHDVHN